MSLMKRPGTKNWYCRFLVRGKWVVKSTYTTDRAQAAAVQDLIRSKARAANEDTERTPRPGHAQPVGEFFLWHLGIADLKPRSKKAYIHAFNKHIAPVLGDRSLTLITYEDCLRVLTTATENGLKATTVNLIRSVLKGMFRVAEDWHYISADPTRRLKKLKEVRFKHRVFTVSERKRLIRECHHISGVFGTSIGSFGMFVELAMHTGMRRSELINLRVEDIDMDNEQIYVDHLKTRDRIIPMNSQVLVLCRRILDNLHPNWDRKVFPFTAAAATAKFSAISKRLGMPARLHDIRHTFATTALRKGANPVDIQHLLGHADLATTMRYMAGGNARKVVEMLVDKDEEAEM